MLIQIIHSHPLYLRWCFLSLSRLLMNPGCTQASYIWYISWVYHWYIWYVHMWYDTGPSYFMWKHRKLLEPHWLVTKSFSTWSNVVTQFCLELCHLLVPRLDACYYMLSQHKRILWISSNWFWISSQNYSQLHSSALVFWDPTTSHPGPFSCCKTGPCY